MKNHTGNIIELTVNNHAGVLSHIAGLFSRRGFNLEGVFCAPKGRGRSLIYLLVSDDSQIRRIISQLGKLYDVRRVLLRPDKGNRLFKRLHSWIRSSQV